MFDNESRFQPNVAAGLLPQAVVNALRENSTGGDVDRLVGLHKQVDHDAQQGNPLSLRALKRFDKLVTQAGG
jgi:hypothetical protein